MFCVLQLEDFEEISFQLFYGVLYVEVHAFRTSGFSVIAVDVLGEYVAQKDFVLRQADGIGSKNSVFVRHFEVARRQQIHWF